MNSSSSALPPKASQQTAAEMGHGMQAVKVKTHLAPKAAQSTAAEMGHGMLAVKAR